MRKRRFESATGRGLAWASIGELVVGVGAILSLVSGNAGTVIGALFIGGFFGLLSVRQLWAGRGEFGPVHEPLARRGTYLFFTAAGLLVASLLAIGTFNSPTHGFDVGDNETESAPDAHRFRDLYPGVLLFCVFLSVEVVSGGHFLWVLAGTSTRPWVRGYVALGVAGAVWIFITAHRSIQELSAEAGGRAGSVDEARRYFDRFSEAVLPTLLLVLAGTRVVAYVLLRQAMGRVREAEAAGVQPAPDAGQP